MAVFERGDIVRIAQHMAVVLTTADFNQLGEAMVAAISQGHDVSRYAGFAVPLTGSGCQTQGVILVNKIQTLDLQACNAQWVERTAPRIVDDALARLMTVFE